MNKITNLTNKNKKTLREFYNKSEGKNYKSISKIARLWSATSDDTYEILRELYNQGIDNEKNIFRKAIEDRYKQFEYRKIKKTIKNALEDRFKELEYRKLKLHEIETTLVYPKSIFHIEDHTFSYLINDIKVFGDFKMKWKTTTINNVNFSDIVINEWKDFCDKAILKLYNKLISYTSPNTYFRLLLKSNKGHALASTKLSSSCASISI